MVIKMIVYIRFGQLWVEEAEDLTRKLSHLRMMERGGFVEIINVVKSKNP